jgi:hypothetical protein
VLAVWLVWLLRVVVRSDCVRWRVGRVKVGYAPSKALKLSATFEVKYNVIAYEILTLRTLFRRALFSYTCIFLI